MMTPTWIGHTLIVSWTLLATVTVLECQNNACRPARVGAARVEHTVGTFTTREACEVQRRTLASPALPTVQSAARPGLIRQKQLTATCVQND
jgi:hypothetical protein